MDEGGSGLVGTVIYGFCARALRMLSYDDVILLAHVLPKPIKRFMLLIGSSWYLAKF